MHPSGNYLPWTATAYKIYILLDINKTPSLEECIEPDLIRK